MLVEAWQFILQHPDRFFAALLRHVELSAAALLFAIALATSSVNSTRRRSVSGGSCRLALDTTANTPHRRPSTVTGAPMAD